MSHLIFSRSQHTLELYNARGQNLGAWEAYNNADSSSKGIWPNGVYRFLYWNAHVGQGVESKYGAHGIFVFDVPGRSGMGVHAGRLHRSTSMPGPQYWTKGCIRTDERAMKAILNVHNGDDPLARIVVANARLGDYPVQSSRMAMA